ncbi:MAG: UvrD-helicase domain-containing protein [Flammeovirgaceae bacterium]
MAREDMQRALKKPDYFKYILAMTFTNKSTQEMKERILKYLYDFTKGQSQDLANEIIANLDAEGVKIKPEQIWEKSSETCPHALMASAGLGSVGPGLWA